MDKTIKDYKKSNRCEHNWDYEIQIINNSNNTYIEKCTKCFKNIRTHEFFE